LVLARTAGVLSYLQDDVNRALEYNRREQVGPFDSVHNRFGTVGEPSRGYRGSNVPLGELTVQMADKIDNPRHEVRVMFSKFEQGTGDGAPVAPAAMQPNPAVDVKAELSTEARAEPDGYVEAAGYKQGATVDSNLYSSNYGPAASSAVGKGRIAPWRVRSE